MQKPMQPNLALVQNRSMSNQGHNLKILIALAPTMIHFKFQGLRSISSGVEAFFLKVFTIFGHGGQFGCVTQTIRIIFCS